MKQLWLGCFLLAPSWPGMGSMKCLSTRWRGQSGTGAIPHGCCHALLNMCFTSCILNCQCIVLLSKYFLWRICALSITMFKQCTKNFFYHLTLYAENCSTVKTDLSDQHRTCTCCTKRLVEVSLPFALCN